MMQSDREKIERNRQAVGEAYRRTIREQIEDVDKALRKIGSVIVIGGKRKITL